MVGAFLFRLGPTLAATDFIGRTYWLVRTLGRKYAHTYYTHTCKHIRLSPLGGNNLEEF